MKYSASRWTVVSCILVVVFAILLGIAVWWFLAYALPSALLPPHHKWKEVVQEASRKHFACDVRNIRFKVLAEAKSDGLNERVRRVVDEFMRSFFRLPELLENCPIVEHSRLTLESGGQTLELYYFPVVDSGLGGEDYSVCFGICRDRYVKMVLLKKSPRSVVGIAGTDYISITFESFQNQGGCVVPTSALVEFFEASGRSSSVRRASIQVRIVYE